MSAPGLRRSWSRRCCLLLNLFLSLRSAQAQPNSPVVPLRDGACDYGAWTPATIVEAPTSMLSATRLVSAALSSGVQRDRSRRDGAAAVGYLVGVAGFEAALLTRPYTWQSTWPPRLRVLRLDGTIIDGPAGAWWFAHPRAVTDAVGTVHVVWAEPVDPLPIDPATLRGSPPPLRTIWYASLTSRKWSRPLRIHHGGTIRWDETTASRLILDGQNRLHVAFAADDSSGWGMVYLSASAAPAREWHAVQWHLAVGVAYLDLAIGPTNRAAIVFASALASPRKRENVLFLTQSMDDVSQWTPVAEISNADEEPATEPHLFWDSPSALKLQWVHQATDSFIGGRMLYTKLTGPRLRRTNTRALSLAGATGRSRAAIDACGTIHVITHAYLGEDTELRYARVSENGWTALVRAVEKPASHPSISVRGQRVHLFWYSETQTSPTSAPLSGLLHASLPTQRATALKSRGSRPRIRQ